MGVSCGAGVQLYQLFFFLFLSAVFLRFLCCIFLVLVVCCFYHGLV